MANIFLVTSSLLHYFIWFFSIPATTTTAANVESASEPLGEKTEERAKKEN